MAVSLSQARKVRDQVEFGMQPPVISRSRYLATCLAIHNITLGQDIGRAQWINAGQEALRLIFTA